MRVRLSPGLIDEMLPLMPRRKGATFFNKRAHGLLQAARIWMLAVEDPNDPDNDLARGSYNINRVRQAFDFAYTQVCATADWRRSHTISQAAALLTWMLDTAEYRSVVLAIAFTPAQPYLMIMWRRPGRPAGPTRLVAKQSLHETAAVDTSVAPRTQSAFDITP